jgi:hypothetical protein
MRPPFSPEHRKEERAGDPDLAPFILASIGTSELGLPLRAQKILTVVGREHDWHTQQ